MLPLCDLMACYGLNFISTFPHFYTFYLSLMICARSEMAHPKVNGKHKGKGLPQHAEVAQGVPSRLGPRIVLTFGTTRVVGRQPYALAAFTPGEIPGTHF